MVFRYQAKEGAARTSQASKTNKVKNHQVGLLSGNREQIPQAARDPWHTNCCLDRTLSAQTVSFHVADFLIVLAK